jgi:uncharacterized secreted repeat protein (TIGR03808 family)
VNLTAAKSVRVSDCTIGAAGGTAITRAQQHDPFSAIRGNGASNIQIIGNKCAQLIETAMYAEFDFEGAIVANNVIDTAENGIAITNFNNGGRLATVRGNLLRNVGGRRADNPPEGAGDGHRREAKPQSRGNVIQLAPNAGIAPVGDLSAQHHHRWKSSARRRQCHLRGPTRRY